jgi:hypothetical protein
MLETYIGANILVDLHFSDCMFMKLCVLDLAEDVFSENGPMFKNINVCGTTVGYFLYRK